MSIIEKHQNQLLRRANVVGVGIGNKITNGRDTGEASVIVFVKDKVPRSQLAFADAVPPLLDDMPTDVIQVGEVFRHLQGGDSVGHYKITAGTAGCGVRDRVTGHRLLLSNNHVLANENDAWIGDAVLSPGPVDGGTVASNTIGYLARFKHIYFHGDAHPEPPPSPEPPPPDPMPIPPSPNDTCGIAETAAAFLNVAAMMVGSRFRLESVNKQVIEPYLNQVDAAICSVNVPNSLPAIRQIGMPIGVVNPFVGQGLQKFGRTTGYTQGSVIAVNTTIDVGYSGTRVARFKDQIITGAISAPGDSGSLVLDMAKNAVGLLFAGSDTITVINPIQMVLDSLGVDLEINSG